MVTCHDTYPIVTMLIERLPSLMFCLQCLLQPSFCTVPRLQLNWTALQHGLVYTISSHNWFLDAHLPKSHPFHGLWHLWSYHQQSFPWCVKAKFKPICFLPRCKVYKSLTIGASGQSTAVLLWKERWELKRRALCELKALFHYQVYDLRETFSSSLSFLIYKMELNITRLPKINQSNVCKCDL